MKKLMTLVLALVLAFTVTAAGFAATGTFDGSWSGDITGGNTEGVITVTTAARITEIISVTIGWANTWDVAYSWQAVTGAASYAWVAAVTDTGAANVITFTATNGSTRDKTVKAVWAGAPGAGSTPEDYGLAVSAAGDLVGASGKLLGYQGSSAGFTAACTLTLAQKAAVAGTSVAGQAAYGSITDGLSSVTLGTMTFTVT